MAEAPAPRDAASTSRYAQVEEAVRQAITLYQLVHLSDPSRVELAQADAEVVGETILGLPVHVEPLLRPNDVRLI